MDRLFRNPSVRAGSTRRHRMTLATKRKQPSRSSRAPGPAPATRWPASGQMVNRRSQPGVHGPAPPPMAIAKTRAMFWLPCLRPSAFQADARPSGCRTTDSGEPLLSRADAGSLGMPCCRIPALSPRSPQKTHNPPRRGETDGRQPGSRRPAITPRPAARRPAARGCPRGHPRRWPCGGGAGVRDHGVPGAGARGTGGGRCGRRTASGASARRRPRRSWRPSWTRSPSG